MNTKPITVLFSHNHYEQLVPPSPDAEDAAFSTLYHMLADELAYSLKPTSEASLSSELLLDVTILVIGAPRNQKEQKPFQPDEVQAIKSFLHGGGAVLLLANAETLYYPPDGFNDVAALADMKVQEFHNYPITYLHVFYPHAVTANVRKVKVGRIAALEVGAQARCLAQTKATQQPVLACAQVGRGRMIGLGDTGLFEDDALAKENNAALTRNIFRWLARQNPVDIAEFTMPAIVKWGQVTGVKLNLRNPDQQARPSVRVELQSNQSAAIPDRELTANYIPPEETISMEWAVKPKKLGAQGMRLTVTLEGTELWHFDHLWPDLQCHAPGYFTLEVKNSQGELQTHFNTGDEFTVEGAFHWDTDVEAQEYKLELEVDDGLFVRSREESYGNEKHWHLKAVEPGDHKLTLTLAESAQTFPAVVSVRRSPEAWLTEIYAAYVYPLEAEIAARLRQIDPRLSAPEIMEQGFHILPPDEYIEAVYTGEILTWIKGVLESARREQWHNVPLLNLILNNIAPTYLPDKQGAFIPYAPTLASHLTQLHPQAAKGLRYNFLCAEESEDIEIKQNVATYLLHEKYGHGFFYTHTRLGQQLTLLKCHKILDSANPASSKANAVAKLLEDSSLIANEGFAAWLELIGLPLLDRDARQAVDLRRVLLIENTSDMYSDFFREFPPKYDSRYREGIEYLEYISRTFNTRCAIRLFVLATNIEFSIYKDDITGNLRFDENYVYQQLFDPEQRLRWHSSVRLDTITNWLYRNGKTAKSAMQQNSCPEKCSQILCPLEALVTSELQ